MHIKSGLRNLFEIKSNSKLELDYEAFFHYALHMNIKYRELLEKNTAGLTVLYIARNDAGNHIFEEDRILWDASEKGLALAEGSPISIEDKKLVMVDANNDMLGFYLVGPAEGDHRVLEPFYCPQFNDLPPPAPKRSRSKSPGTLLDKESFDFYLRNLKEFLI